MPKKFIPDPEILERFYSSDEESPTRTAQEYKQKFSGVATCSRCKKNFPVEDLTAIQVRFQMATKSRAQKKSVTAAKLCDECLNDDEHWGPIWRMEKQWR